MSRVWAARLRGTRGFSKLVAIKTLVAEGPNRAMLERMLLAEARMAARIQHPNVAQYQDLGERDGVLYVVMEWVDGESLSVLMKQAARVGGIPLRIAAQILSQTCHGLHFAHELEDEAGESLGLVHCDISPHNVMIGGTGAVKVIDFGIAKAKSGAPMEDDGMVAGKPAFMAPEQARAGSVDRRADVFSLGILAYQLTTGRHPFGAGTPAETLQRVIKNAPVIPPCAADPTYPAALERVVMKALSHRPEDRFDTALQMMYQLVAAVPDQAHELEVCSFMQQICADSLRDRRALVGDALKAAAAREDGESRLPMMSMVDGGNSTGLTDRAASTTSTTAPSAASVIAQAAPAPRRGLTYGLVALSACAAIGIAAARGPLASRLNHDAAAAPQPAATLVAAEAPAPRAEVVPALAPAASSAAVVVEQEPSAEPAAPSTKKRRRPAIKARSVARPPGCVGAACAPAAVTPPAAPAAAPAAPARPVDPISDKYGI